MSKYYMISLLSRSALHITSRALGIARVAGLLGLMGLEAACGGGGGSGTTTTTTPPATVTLSSIAVTPANASVVAGLTVQLTATGTYSDGSTKDLTSTATWQPGDSSKATVSSSGLVTGVAAGSTTINVSYTDSSGTKQGSDALTVAPPNLTSITLSPNKPTLGLNKTIQFYATGTYTDNSSQDLTKSVTWNPSSNSSVVTINSSGAVSSAGNIGTATITATMSGLTSSAVTVTVATTVYAYATNFDSNNVSQYTIGNDGSLTPIASGTVSTGNQPFSISVEPTGEYVYVSNWISSTVSQYRIGTDGSLTPIASGSVPTGNSPNAVTIDPSDKYAYVANLGENTISQYTIGIDGQLAVMSTAKVAAGSNPATIAVSPSGKFAYAGNYGANAATPPAGPSTISQYTVGSDGSLTPMNGAAATAASGSGPCSIVIDPTSHYLYVAQLGDNNIGQYTINTDGTLTALTTVASPQGVVAAGTQPAGIAMDVTGHYVYVANQGDGTISAYTVGGDGSLTANGAAVASGTGVSSVTVDPTGAYVYATNRGDTTISQFKINSGGTLTALTTATVQAGTHPTAIATGY